MSIARVENGCAGGADYGAEDRFAIGDGIASLPDSALRADGSVQSMTAKAVYEWVDKSIDEYERKSSSMKTTALTSS
ncbi:hypothetical protein [Herbaspirillum robiniae]|uniref:Uncharacterized protein n=1 Tax=Herbaspirillum robiniae TaxID=2014887 RepID=A0ABX2LTN0_9BURK|nr:hypothetical protein [Herbaspirillum robiniae]NUU00253.1 hypothetical protein [Herbaspirillum robiniae]